MFRGLLLKPRTLGLLGGNKGKRAVRETAVSFGHSKCTELCSESGPGMGSLVLALALWTHWFSSHPHLLDSKCPVS